MIETFKKYKTLLAILGITVVVFFGYTMFFDGGGNSGGVVLTSQNATVRGGDNELLLLLVNLRSITLNDAIFSEPAFKTLIDFGQQLVPEPTGRQNPFAPIGSDSI
ncbi:MAG: hypothetical protein WD153_03050 [Candidatus Paceibacterota bacterium]